MIKEKRGSLETFIREQLIGPGGCKGMYAFKNTNHEKDLGEVISTTPGSIYSTAILFPEKEEESTNDERDNTHLQSDNTTDISDDIPDDDDDLTALGRRFPSKIGISCCLKEDFAPETLKVVVSGRYYTKIQPTDLEVVVADCSGFDDFFTREILPLGMGFVWDKRCLALSQPISRDSLFANKTTIRDLNKKLAAEIAKNADGSDDSIYTGIKQDYRFLSSYKERLFKALTTVKNNEYLTSKEVDQIRSRIAKIERYETYLAYVEDLITACDSRSFGYWVAHPFSKTLDLGSLNLKISEQDGKVVYNPQEHACLKNIVAVQIDDKKELSLSVWLQLMVRNNKLYFKVLLDNTSTKVAVSARQYYSIVSEQVNTRCFFGITIDVSSPALCPYKEPLIDTLDDQEAAQLNFLYRKIDDYGAGHLCSVDWRRDHDGVMHVFSEFIPSIETPDVEPVPRDQTQEVNENGIIYPKPYLEDTECLQFKWLSIFSQVSDNDVIEGLKDFADSYKKWIDIQRQNRQPEAQGNMNACEEDYLRMRTNIDEFLQDPQKMRAFRMMNAAMFMQLWHNKKENQAQIKGPQLDITFYKNASDDIFPGVQHAAWRPFQLAFILLNLDGIFQRHDDPDWDKRNKWVDLVWFPTGGGKTEAYLGLIALTIINRRMTRAQSGFGVSVIMRYTLRLLATQQFQRALRLILALEQIRQWNVYPLGDEQISIGLYVGGASLPNGRTELQNEAAQWAQRKSGNNNSKIPLDVCPWCGARLNYENPNNGRVNFYCENDNCTFHTGIPVRLCDEDIYQYPPTLLFGTVDKFALLARKVNTNKLSMKADSHRLFGRGYNWTVLPPELIIQDELHLLLGPLGSAVGLFECVIDKLCTRKENGKSIRPKIISSTATTRNTSLQVRALYDRNVSIFPKNGVNYDDSYFAFYKRCKKPGDKEWSYISKRKYLGIMPTGRTQMTAQMRLAAILFVHRALFEKEHLSELNNPDFIKAADYYYTTVSYFNSLKEVGKTDAQFYLEFTKYTRRLFKRVMRNSDMLECLYAYNEGFSVSELTSRLSGSEVVSALNRIQSVTWNPDRRFPYQENNGQWRSASKPDDLLLATNMISVGLDVSRLNVMIINSMPRNIAEYIQASSRVAREREGLVLTLHNPFRFRDVSHFEKFKEFHEKLYYYVEPISITPFSRQAVEKYLPLALGVWIRHFYPNLADNTSAGLMTRQLADTIKDEFCQYFMARQQHTDDLPLLEQGLLTPALLDYIKTVTDTLLTQWLNKIGNLQPNEQLVYDIPLGNQPRAYNRRVQRALFAKDADYEGPNAANLWRVPMALRNLDPEAVIHVEK